MSLPIDEIVTVLRDHLPSDAKLLNAIASDLLKAEREIKADKQATPRGKTRLVALIRTDGDPAVARALEAGAYVVQVPDGTEDGGELPEASSYHGEALLQRLRKAAIAHNEAPRKRRGKPRIKVETWHQAFSHIKAKTLKESGSNITIKAKGMPVEVVGLLSETVQPKETTT